MADNIDVTPGTGKTIAADDLAGVLYQRVKISQGADGSATDVSSAAPLNVTLANTGANTNKLLVTPDLPTGASTSAKQDTIIGHVDGLEALATTIDADTSNISTKIDTIAGAVSGTEMQVDIVSAPTLTVNAHAVTNAGTFATQVDGAALTSLQLADDVVATLGTTTYTEASTKGTTIGAVRRDADTTLVDTTNEIGPLQMDANGRLKVEVFSGETLPVSGTVTADLGATDNAVLDAIAASTAAIETAVEGTLVVDGSGVTQPVSGTFWQATQPVSGTVAATIAAGATSIAKAEDVASADADVGVPALAVRKATPANVSGTDGDYEFLQMSAGRLWVDASGKTLTVDGSGVTQPVSGTVAASQSGTWNVTNVSGTVSLPTGASTSALQTTGNSTLGDIDTTTGLTYGEIALIRAAAIVDDAAFTPGSTRVMMSGFEYDDTTPDSVNEGDGGAARMSANRNIYVNIRDNAGNERGLNIDSNGALASVISSGTVTTVTTVTTVSTITGGGVAHDAADSGNPIKVGGKYYATLPALTDGDRGDLVMSREGEVQVRAGGQILKSDVNFTRPSDTTTYASGDVVSDSTSAPNVLTFTGVARANGLGGVIETVLLIDESCSTLAGVFELWLFDTAPTATNDNTAWNISDANMRTVIGMVPLTAAFSGDAGSTGNRLYVSPNTGISFKCTSGVTSIYGVLVVRNAFVPTSAERFDIRLTTIAE